MKRALSKSTAVLLAFLMVFSSVGMILSLAGVTVDGSISENEWPDSFMVVDGINDTANWADRPESADTVDYGYAWNLTKDDANLYFAFITKTANIKSNGDVFRLWLRDNAAATAYTDFITVKNTVGTFSVSSAKYNSLLDGNSGVNWSDELIGAIEVTSAVSGDDTSFEVKIPLSAFDGLENQTFIDAWASFWPNAADAATYTCLHSGASGTSPTGGKNVWSEEYDFTLSWATVDGVFDESCWSDGWTTVDGDTVGQWQTASSTANDAFAYDYKFHASSEYLYLGVKYNKAPTFVSDTQTGASNIRVWLADLAGTPTGKFGTLIDIRYVEDKAVVCARDDAGDLQQIDRSKVAVADAQGADYWYVELAIPLSELGLEGWSGSDYYGLAITASDPFVGGDGTAAYGALHSVYGFDLSNRTTWGKYYLAGYDFPEFNEDAIDESKSYIANIASDETVVDLPTGFGNYTANLFDGAYTDAAVYDNSWYGFYEQFDDTGAPKPENTMVNGVASVYFDFGKDNTDIGTIRAHIGGGASGIGLPASISVYGSTDNEHWVYIDDLEMYEAPAEGWSAGWAEISFEKALDSRYLRIDFKKGSGVFVFVNEVEVISYEYIETFYADFANQYSVGYQDPSTWTYNGGETLSGVGDAVYLYTDSGKTLYEAVGQTFVWWYVWGVDYDEEADAFKIVSFDMPGTGKEKGDVLIPENGFVIASCGHGNEGIPAALKADSCIGTKLYVYGAELDILGVKDTMDFKNENIISVGNPLSGRDDLYTPSDEAKLVYEAIEGTITTPDGYGPIEILLDGDKTSITGYEGNQSMIFMVRNGDVENSMKYKFTRFFTRETVIDKITLSILNYSNGNVGLPESVVVSIGGKDYTAVNVTGGTDNAINDFVVELDNAVAVTEFVVTVTHPAGAVKYNAWTEIATESSLVELPEDAIVIDNLGYQHDATVNIMVGDGMTVGEITTAQTGTERDNNYTKLIVVNKYGIVTETYMTLGEAKTDVVCPEGGYIISYNANKAGYAVMDSISCGDRITLYNIDLEKAAAITPEDGGFITIVNGGFTVSEIGTGITNLSDPDEIKIDDLSKLTDGDFGLNAGNWGTDTGSVQLITNLNPTDESINPTVALLYKLDEAKAINSVKLGFYHCYNVMIGLPKDGKVNVSISENGYEFTDLGALTLEVTPSAGAYGTVVLEGKYPDNEIAAQYVLIEYEIGPSGLTADGKVVWEFTAMTEITAEIAAPEEPEGMTVDGSLNDWPGSLVTVDGINDTDNWTDMPDSAATTDYGYTWGITKDEDNLYFALTTKTANIKANGDVFRIWLRDNSAATVYTDFVTFKATDGVISLSSAKYNQVLDGNSGADWSDELKNSVVLASAVSGEYTTFEGSIPLSAFDGLANQTVIDAWASLWPNAEDNKAYSCLHSGATGVAPTGGANAWSEEYDFTLSWANVDGEFDESCWSDGWITVDGDAVGQWQTASSTENDAFAYDYKFHASTEYLYLGVKFNKAPSFITDTQTGASNIRVWLADLEGTPTGKFGTLIDVRYVDGAAVICARDDSGDLQQIDRSKVTVADTQGADYWYVEVAIPLSELGLEGWSGTDYYGLAVTASDPFPDGDVTAYGALHSVYGFDLSDRTTWGKFYLSGLDYPESNGVDVLPDQSDAVNIATGENVVTDYPVGYGNYTADLFDGVYYEAISYDNKWFAFYTNASYPDDTNTVGGIGSVIIDLGADDAVFGGIRAHIGSDTGAGISLPESITAYASVDGSTWLKIGELSMTDAKIQWASLTLDKELVARYIKLDFKTAGIFMFVNEIEVIDYQYVPSFVADTANEYVYDGNAVILFTEHGKTIGEVSGQGFGWWNVWVFDYDFEAGAYKVVEYKPMNGGEDKSGVVIPDTGFVVAAHGSGISRMPAEANVVGTEVYVYGINVDVLDGIEGNVITVGQKFADRDDIFTPIRQVEFTPVDGTITTPEGYGSVNVLIDGDKTDITGYEGNQSKIFMVCNGDTESSMKYTLTRRFYNSTAIDKITLSILNYTAGNVGLPESVIVTINGVDYDAVNVTGGKDGCINDYVVELDNAVAVTEFVVTVTHPAGDVNYNAWTEIAAESSLVELPEGAIAIDNLGYRHAGSVSIMVGDGMTIGEITLAQTGTIRDNNYAKVITVNKYGFVTGTYLTLAQAKTDVVCPEGGYIISYNGNKAGHAVMDSISVGDYIRLYNVNLEKAASLTPEDGGFINILQGGFTVTKIGDGVTNLSDPDEVKIDDTSKLTDGDFGLNAGNWGTDTGSVQLIQNLNPTDASINPTVKLLYKLDEVQYIDIVRLGFYNCLDVMIGLPKDNEVRISVSENGYDFKEIGVLTLEAVPASGEYGTELVSGFSFDSSEEAQYVLIEFEIGPSGLTTDGKVVWEFTAMTEIFAEEHVPFDIIKDELLVDGENGYAFGNAGVTYGDLFAADTFGDIYAAFDGKTGEMLSADDIIKTGDIITDWLLFVDSSDFDSLTVVVRGDVNGSGTVSQIDYLFAKLQVTTEGNLFGPYLAAADYNDDGRITQIDCLLMKRAVLGLN